MEERLQEVYDWELMQLMDQWEQEQLKELEGIAALFRTDIISAGPNGRIISDPNIASIGRRPTTDTGTSSWKFVSIGTP
jgi:hypothetical protein